MRKVRTPPPPPEVHHFPSCHTGARLCFWHSNILPHQKSYILLLALLVRELGCLGCCWPKGSVSLAAAITIIVFNLRIVTIRTVIY